MSKIETNTIDNISGSSTLNIGGTNATTLALAAGIKTDGFGKIAQIKYSTKNTETSTNSTSFIDVPGFSVNITPSTTTSKIIVFVWGRFGVEDGQQEVQHKLLRDTTTINLGRDLYNDQSGGGMYVNGFHMFAIDEPASTSQLTYKLQTRSEASTNRSRIIGDDVADINPLAYLVAIEVLD